MTPEEVQTFKRLIFEKKGIELSDEEAFEQAQRLIKLFDLLIQERKKKIVNNDQKVIINDEE